MKRLLSVVVGLGLWAAVSHAAVPEKLSIQGILEDGSGQILTEEPTSLTFRIYDAATSGTLLWTEVHNSGSFTFDKGVFSAVLGEITALSGVSFADPRWISIQVESNAEQTPRIELTASAYSLMAKTVSDDAVTSAKIADGAVAAVDLASGVVVTSVNGLSDAVGLEGDGSIISVSSSGQTITISSVGVSGASSVSADDDAVITADGDDDGSGDVLFKSGPDTRMVIANDGKVGIGTTDPDGTLHAMTASGGTITPHTSADDFIVENSGDTGVSVFSGSSAAGYLAFGSSTNNWGGVMRYTHNNNQLYFHTDAGTNYMVFDDGNVGIGTPTPGADLDIVTTTSDPDIHLKEDSNHFGSLFWSRSGDYLGFHTNTSAGGSTRMVIAGDGKVGIGKVPDTFLLDIEASSAGSGIMRLKATNSSHYSGVTLLNDSVTWNLAVAGSAVGGTGNKFYIHDGSDYLTTWDGVNDRVGIGTISPDATLTIADSTNYPYSRMYLYPSGAHFRYSGTNTSEHSAGLTLTSAKSGFAALTENWALGSISFEGYVGGSSQSPGAKIYAYIDGTPGSGDIPTRLEFKTTPDGSASPVTRMTIHSTGGVTIGSPTGGDKGAGTLNAVAVYDDGQILSDHVFDWYFDGEVRAEDQERHGDYTMMSLQEMITFMEKERHLPTIEGRDEWNEKGSFSLGSLTTQLWVTVETQALYIKELKESMDAKDVQLQQVQIDIESKEAQWQKIMDAQQAALQATQRQLVQLNAQMAQVQKQIAAQTTSNATLADAK